MLNFKSIYTYNIQIIRNWIKFNINDFEDL